MMKRPKNFRGFTLIELMVTIAILAIVTAMAAPGLQDFIRSNRLSSTSGTLAADLAFARNESIRRNQIVLICRTEGCGSTGTNWAAGWAICYDGDSNGACDSAPGSGINPNPIRTRGTAQTGLTVTGPNANIEFHPNGRQGAAGSATLTFSVTGSWTSGANNNYFHSVSNTGVSTVKKT